MKKALLYNLLLLAVGITLTSCEKDLDSNPTLKVNTTGFVLNTPANAANNTYDLANSNSINLKCSQPDFGGFPVVTNYNVQVSIDPAFADTTAEAPRFAELSTAYQKANMDVNSTELNDTLIALYKEVNGEDAIPTEAMPVYIRLRAHVNRTDYTNTLSNVI